MDVNEPLPALHAGADAGARPGRGEPVAILIAALGGQGGGVLTDWIVNAARLDGMVAQATSSPGVSQRSGATTYYVELAPPPAAGAPPRTLGLMPVPGRVDVLVCAELLEAARMLERGFATPSRTTVIASTHRVYTTIEKANGADGRVDGARVLAAIGALAKRSILADFDSLRHACGTAISAPLFGALAGSGAVPLSRRACEEAIRAAGKGVDGSLAAFAAAYERAADAAPSDEAVRGAPAPAPALPAAIDARVRALPEPVRAVARAAAARLADYQDAAYASVYLDRLEPLAGIDPEVAAVAARELARWMGYEDAARVASLKVRRARLARIRAQVSAGPRDVVRVREMLAPSVGEVAAMLPARLGAWVERRARGRGRRRSVSLETSSVAGALALAGIAALGRLRPRSLRYAREQAAIGEWLAALGDALARPGGRRAALALATLPALRRGYGEAHARALARYDKVFAAFAGTVGADPDGAADALLRERDTALADPDAMLPAAPPHAPPKP